MNQTPQESTIAVVPIYDNHHTSKRSALRAGLAGPLSVAVALAGWGASMLVLAVYLYQRRESFFPGGIETLLISFSALFALSVFLLLLRHTFLLSKIKRLARTEIKLQESEKRFKELFENMNSCVAIYEAAADGRDFIFKAVNKAMESSEQIDRTSIIGRSVMEVFHGVKEYGLFDLLQRVWQTGLPEYLPARYYQEDRRQGWKENSAYKLPTGEIVVIYNDVSKRKRAEEALRRSEETFTHIFRANPAAMMISRPGCGTILNVNAAFEKLTGCARSELIGRQADRLDLWTTPDEKKAFVHLLSKHESVTDREMRLCTPTGKARVTLYSSQMIRLPTESCLLSILVDVSQVRQAEEERIKLEKQLHESQKMEAIGALAGGIAHDFNNILGGIIGYAEMAARQPDPQKHGRCLDQILLATERAKDLVMQILTFSRHGEDDKKPIDLRIIVKESLKLLRSTLPSSIDVRCGIENTPFTACADPTRMHQIVMNICTNAAHAMGEKGGVLKVALALEKLSCAEASEMRLNPGDYIRLTISDSGSGIDPAVINRIFDPFFTTKKPGQGTGLGLAVVYGIVQNHRGQIRVASQPGEGATFDIYLPHLDSRPAVSTAVASERTVGGHERLLFVDDESALVELANKNFSDLGYDITACTDSVEALRIFQSDPDGFDLIVTDMTMPRLSGSDLAREIIRLRPGQPIMLCTGHSDFITPEKAAALGIQTFALKPLSRKDLAAAVRKTLDDPPARGALQACR